MTEPYDFLLYGWQRGHFDSRFLSYILEEIFPPIFFDANPPRATPTPRAAPTTGIGTAA